MGSSSEAHTPGLEVVLLGGDVSEEGNLGSLHDWGLGLNIIDGHVGESKRQTLAEEVLDFKILGLGLLDSQVSHDVGEGWLLRLLDSQVSHDVSEGRLWLGLLNSKVSHDVSEGLFWLLGLLNSKVGHDVGEGWLLGLLNGKVGHDVSEGRLWLGLLNSKVSHNVSEGWLLGLFDGKISHDTGEGWLWLVDLLHGKFGHEIGERWLLLFNHHRFKFEWSKLLFHGHGLLAISLLDLIDGHLGEQVLEGKLGLHSLDLLRLSFLNGHGGDEVNEVRRLSGGESDDGSTGESFHLKNIFVFFNIL